MQNEILSDELDELNPTEVRLYAMWEGWKPVSTKNKEIILLTHPTRKLQQIILPTYATKTDNLRMLEEAVRTLAEDVGRSVEELVKDLLLPPADIVQLCLRAETTTSGTVPLETGLGLIQNGRDLLLAAASSAYVAQGHYARMSHKPAVEFLKTCRLGQTDKGSFIATIHAPVPSSRGLLFVEPVEDMTTAPFARKATMMLMKGIASIRTFLDQSAPELISEDIERGVSANLCEALTALKIDDQQAELEIGMRWSRSRPHVPESIPSRVAFKRHEFQYIEAAGQKLREKTVKRTERIEGQIINLHAEPANLLEGFKGIVTMRAVIDAENTRVRFNLARSEYLQACDAHRDGKNVIVNGVLQRDPAARQFELADVHGFMTAQSGDFAPSS